MKNRTRKRILTFERLESKATPSSLLLILAPLDDLSHMELESANAVEAIGMDGTARAMVPEIDTSANWQFSVSTSELLRFVEANTQRTNTDSFASRTPTVEHCRCADEMMRLNDMDVRTLVITECLDA